jgi:hypothetical protein
VGDFGSSVNGVDCGTGSVPDGIGDRFAVFYGGDLQQPIGFRDLEGRFYDAAGQPAEAIDVLLRGTVRSTSTQIAEEMFEDYTPRLALLPRIAFHAPVGQRMALFAGFDVVSRRPTAGAFATLKDFAGTGALGNTNLRPAYTQKLEAGVRQVLTSRLVATATGFYYRGEDLSETRSFVGATPAIYTGQRNDGDRTVKGIELVFELRPSAGFGFHAHYTYSEAIGTEAGLRSPYPLLFAQEAPPPPNAPLDHDVRHAVKLNAEYRLGPREGPELLGIHPLAQVGINLFVTASSSFPYTPVLEPWNLAEATRVATPIGGINNTRMNGMSRVDLRVDRRFSFGNERATAALFLWVQNLFDRQNIHNVWPYTGLAGTDGFLSTAAGTDWLATSPPQAEALYRHLTRVASWTGLPRLVRIGIRMDF